MNQRVNLLNDEEIIQAVNEQNLISPFNPSNLTPNGYDLSIQSILVNGSIEVNQGQYFVFQPGDTALIRTNEILRMGAHIGLLRLRSTYARAGLCGSFGVIDSGFEGSLSTRITNIGTNSVPLAVGVPFVQLVIFPINLPVSGYEERSGTYQNVQVSLANLERMCIERLWSYTESLMEVSR